ncbi:MAG: RDD family protein [Ignavibacteriae bacterium]|nr:RDD family protein [Ignavibacteriota bacterium]
MATYAGFWKRFAAYIIDSIIISIACFIIIVPLLGLLGIGLFTSSHDYYGNEEVSAGFLALFLGAYMSAIIVLIIGQWLYFAIMESTKGATLGKMALGIKVTDMNGSMISFGRATGRYFGKILSGLILYIGFIMAAFTQQKQALHDIMAGTLVVNK